MATLSSPIPPSVFDGGDQRRIPPLQAGDRLTHSQYMERYEAMPPKVKAERIEGIVYMPAALSSGFHGQPQIDVSTWLGTYRASTPGVVAAADSTTIMDMDNDPQPDASLRILTSHGGRTKLSDPEKYIVGAAELIVEITASSVSYDLGAKLNAYRRNCVQEYVVHRTYDGEIDWFVLRDGQYDRLPIGGDGVYRSEVFAGLWLKADALITGNLAEVLAVLQRGIADASHAEFVKKLESQRIAGQR